MDSCTRPRHLDDDPALSYAALIDPPPSVDELAARGRVDDPMPTDERTDIDAGEPAATCPRGQLHAPPPAPVCARTPPPDPPRKPAPLHSAAMIDRIYNDVANQFLALRRALGVDDAAAVAALAALVRDEPLPPPFAAATAEQVDVLRRVAWILHVRAPSLRANWLALSTMQLDMIARDQRAFLDAVRDVCRIEQLGDEARGQGPADRALRDLLGPEAADPSDLDVVAGDELARRLAGPLERLRRSGRADALADEIVGGIVEDAAGPLFAALNQRRQALAADDETPPAERVAGLLALARKQLDEGEVGTAATLCSAALQIDPSSVAARVLRAEARTRNDEPFGADDDAEAAVALAPDDLDALLCRAAMHHGRGRLDAAIRDADAALARAPDPRAHFLRGVVHQRAGRLVDAITDLGRALDLDPAHLGARGERGYLLSQLGDPNGALADYDAALRVDPDRTLLRIRRGNLHAELGDLDAALADLDAAAALEPDSSDVFYNRGNIHLQRGDAQAAYDDYTRALEGNPDDVQSRLNRAHVLVAAGQLQAALDDCNAAIAAAPGYWNSFSKRALVFAHAGRSDLVAADLEQALALAPPDWPQRADAEEMLTMARADPPA